MKQQSLIVRHRSLRPEDAEAIDEFAQSVTKGLNEWARREGLTVEIVSEKLRRTMLERIIRSATSLITADAVARIHGAESVEEARKLALSITDKLSRFVYSELVVMSGLPRRGRRREFADRDRLIYRMYRSGSSYGEIAIKLHVFRHAVQAAFRREESWRISFCKKLPQLKQFLGSIGILLEEEKVAD
jgi:hypothetical protein